MANEKNEWGSNISFLLAMIGSAVGLGNIWRFPYVLYSNGGGAFYIPYITAVLILGIPFLILEYGVGYNFKSSLPIDLTFNMSLPVKSIISKARCVNISGLSAIFLPSVRFRIIYPFFCHSYPYL